MLKLILCPSNLICALFPLNEGEENVSKGNGRG